MSEKAFYSGNGSYKMHQYADSTWFAKTTVQWRRTYGKCNTQYHNRCGEAYARSTLRAWGRRNDIFIEPDDLAKMPTNPWGK